MGVEIDNKNIEILFNYLKSILYDNPVVVPELNTMEAPYYKLGQGLEVLQELTEEMLTYSSDISQGNLSVPYPSKENPLCSNLKKIHASLRQLTYFPSSNPSVDSFINNTFGVIRINFKSNHTE